MYRIKFMIFFSPEELTFFKGNTRQQMRYWNCSQTPKSTLPVDNSPGAYSDRLTLAYVFTFQNIKHIIQWLVHTLKEFMHVPSWIGRNIAPNEIIMHSICYAKAIRHHWGKPTYGHSWAAQSAGGQNVMIDLCISLVLVKVWKGRASGFSQIPQAKQVSVKPLTCQNKMQ